MDNEREMPEAWREPVVVPQDQGRPAMEGAPDYSPDVVDAAQDPENAAMTVLKGAAVDAASCIAAFVRPFDIREDGLASPYKRESLDAAKVILDRVLGKVAERKTDADWKMILSEMGIQHTEGS